MSFELHLTCIHPRFPAGGCGTNALAQQRELLSKITFGAEATQVPLPPSVETAGVPIVCSFNKVLGRNLRPCLPFHAYASAWQEVVIHVARATFLRCLD